MNTLTKLTLAAIVVGLPTTHRTAGQEYVIAQHREDTNPVSEGFTLFSSGNPILAPIVGDLGWEAWAIGLPSYSDIGQYSRRLQQHEATSVAVKGWNLSLTLRVVPPYAAPTYGTFAAFYSGESYTFINFGADFTGQPMIRLNGTMYSLGSIGAGYHTYCLQQLPGDDKVRLWVDGDYLAGATGIPSANNAEFAWGGGQHPPGSAYANWNDVTLSIIPEPSSPAVLGVGGAVLALTRRHRPRSAPAV